MESVTRPGARIIANVLIGALIAVLAVQTASDQRVGQAQGLPATPNNIQVYGSGGGTGVLTLMSVLNLPGTPSIVYTGNFLGDASADVAGVYCVGSTCSTNFFPGIGDGTFGPPSTFGLPGGCVPNAVTTSNFDLFGGDDVVVGCGDGNVYLFLAPNFGNPFRTFACGCGAVRSLASGLLNPEDAFPDIAVLGSTGLVPIIHRQGANFTLSPLIPLTGGRKVTLGRGNSTFPVDSFFDIFVTLNPIPGDIGSVNLFPNNGLGGFPSTPSHTFPTGVDPFSVAVGDFNGDSSPDIVVLNLSSGTVSIFPAISNGAGYQQRSDVNVSANPIDFAPANIMNDSLQDLYVITGDGQIRALANTTVGTGATTFNNIRSTDCGTQGATSLGVADFTGDGLSDVAVGGCQTTSATPSTTPPPPSTTPTGTSSVTPTPTGTPTGTPTPTGTSTATASATAGTPTSGTATAGTPTSGTPTAGTPTAATSTPGTPVTPPSATPITPVTPPSPSATPVTPVAPPTGITPVVPPSPTPTLTPPPPTFPPVTPLPSQTPTLVQNPRYSVAPNGPTGCDPADILAQRGVTGVPCAGVGSPDVVIACASLTFPESCSAPGASGPPLNDDVTSLSFANDRIDPTAPPRMFFSVDTSSVGCAGAVLNHALSGHPDTDEFLSNPSSGPGLCPGTNSVFLSASALNLIENSGPEPPNNDDELDALSWPPTPSGAPPYFTLAPGSPTLSRIGATPGDILTTSLLGAGPSIALSHTALGLRSTDAIDGMCLFGTPTTTNVLFTLSRGSPSLAGPDGIPGTSDDLSPADILRTGPVVFRRAGQLGLLATDNVDALKCSEPAPLPPLPSPATPVPGGTVGGRDITATSLGDGRISLTWSPGTRQAAYRLSRLTALGTTLLPALSPSANSATDTVPLADPVACYLLEALDGSGNVIGRADVLCMAVRIANGAFAGNFAIQLAQSNEARLSWSGAAGATAYLFIPLSDFTVQLLPATARSAIDNTGGAASCYVLATRVGNVTTGFTDAACAIPGMSFFLS